MTSSPSKPRLRCMVVSDLHIGAPFADQDDTDRLLGEQLSDKKNPVTHCVLLGDIYECLNLTKKEEEFYPYFQIRMRSHIDHLRGLVMQHPHCTFHYVLGNHERHPEFDRLIDQLADELKGRLIVDREFVKIGDGLFVHGDQAMRPQKYHVKNDTKYDESFAELARHEFWQGWKDMTNRLLPWPIARLFHRRTQCARAITQWAHAYDAQHPEKQSVLEGVHHIFMGHTHDPFTAFEFSDPKTGATYNLYNTGASVFKFLHVNRHCFNALNFYLESGDIQTATIKKISSVNWPKHHWPRIPSNEEVLSTEPIGMGDEECRKFGVPRGSFVILCEGNGGAKRFRREVQARYPGGPFKVEVPNGSIKDKLSGELRQDIESYLGDRSDWSIAIVPNEGGNIRRLFDGWERFLQGEGPTRGGSAAR